MKEIWYTVKLKLENSYVCLLCRSSNRCQLATTLKQLLQVPICSTAIIKLYIEGAMRWGS